MLAHNCAVLGIPVDPLRLYQRDDETFMIWLEMVVDMVQATNKAAAKK
jgi:hypothetical protein